MRERIAVVTGGNTGIGKETVRGLAKAGLRVVLACRDVAKGRAARDEVTASVPGARVDVEALDLSSLESVRAFAATLRGRHPAVDVLVNNAGVYHRARRLTQDGFEETFGVNHLGHFLLTALLTDALVASGAGRIVVVASKMHLKGRLDFDDLMAERRYKGIPAYCNSKVANVAHAAALSRRLRDRGVVASSLHPGVVATEIVRDYPAFLVRLYNLFLISPEAGARTSLYLATSSEAATVGGGFYDRCKLVRANPQAMDPATQDHLWAVSERLVGLA